MWSVIIPYYNEAAYIGDTLTSLARQSMKPDVIILANNASSDSSEQVCREVMAAWPEIEVVHLLVSKPGQVHALEAGIAAAKTEFVAICDADTYYPPQYLERANHYLKSGGKDVLAVIAYYLDPRHGPFRQGLSRWHQLLAASALPWQCHSGGAGQSFRLSALRDSGGYNAEQWPYVLKDHELIHRILKRGRVLYRKDLWCAPSPRRSDRSMVRWTLLERLLYHATPFALKDWYFYSFLKSRFIARSMQDTRLRAAAFAAASASTEAAAKPRLILCADDYGLSPGISEAIRTLARKSALSATCAMVTTPDWQAEAPALRELRGVIDIGLHLTLTQLPPAGAMPRLAPAGRLPTIDRLTCLTYTKSGGFHQMLPEIAAEIERQFDLFETAMGQAPDFVDGHQHCHILPGIRALVLDITRRRAPHAWLRNCADQPRRILTRGGDRIRALRSAWLGRGFKAEARAHGLDSNDSFAGFYDFSPTAPLPKLYRSFYAEAAAAHLVMCHPGSDDMPGDRIAKARQQEYQFLTSPAAKDLMAAKGLTLGRFPARTLP